MIAIQMSENVTIKVDHVTPFEYFIGCSSISMILERCVYLRLGNESENVNCVYLRFGMRFGNIVTNYRKSGTNYLFRNVRSIYRLIKFSVPMV